jgi:hypothetical protein
MATTYTVVGDLMVAGSVKGESIAEQVLVDWPANIPALIEGGHIEVLAGGDPAPVDPAPVLPDAPLEG